MLSEPRTLDPKQRDVGQTRDAALDNSGRKPSGRDASGRDASADFIQELAESGTASELGTVKAASDAAEKDEGRDPKKPRPRSESAEQS